MKINGLNDYYYSPIGCTDRLEDEDLELSLMALDILPNMIHSILKNERIIHCTVETEWLGDEFLPDIVHNSTVKNKKLENISSDSETVALQSKEVIDVTEELEKRMGSPRMDENEVNKSFDHKYDEDTIPNTDSKDAEKYHQNSLLSSPEIQDCVQQWMLYLDDPDQKKRSKAHGKFDSFH